MTSIKVRGVNRVRAKGRIYYYHRAIGKRIQADPNDAAAFAAEVAAHNASKPATEVRRGTLGGLLAAYRGAPRPFSNSPQTLGVPARL